GLDAQVFELLGGFAADAPQRVGGSRAQDLVPVVAGQPEDPGGLAEAGSDLGLEPVAADADRGVEFGGGPDGGLDGPGYGLGVVGVHGQEGLVPAHDLHDVAQPAQR